MRVLFIVDVLFKCKWTLSTTDSEVNRVGSYSNPIVISDDESDGESYTRLDLDKRLILKLGLPYSDDELIRAFDHARGQTQKDIYTSTWRSYLDSDSDTKWEEDEPQPKIIERSTRAEEPNYHCVIQDIEDFEDEIFTPEKYKKDKNRNDDIIP